MIAIETFLYEIFVKVSGNVLSDGVLKVFEKIKTILSKKSFDKLDKLASNKEEKEFNKILEIILEKNEDMKNKLIELQKEPNNSINIDVKKNSGSVVGKIDTQNNNNNNNNNNNYYSSLPTKNYEENYQKAIQAMKNGLYDKAEKLFNEFTKEVDDIKDAKLLLISCLLSSKRIDKINDSLVDRCFNTIDKYFKDNYLGLIILGILHIDYYDAKSRKPPSGLSLKDILVGIKNSTDITDYQFALISIETSKKAKQKLNLV